MTEQDREKPLHRGVIFVEINKAGICRISGYTGSKDEGDQNLIGNVSAGDPKRCDRFAVGILEDLIKEMFSVYEKQATDSR